MSTKQIEKRASYTLFSVTQEDRESRSKRIRDFFKEQPALAYLMAAFDFEWTVRRAIVLMSKCPISVIKARLNDKRYSGWNAYQDAWTCCVQKTRDDGTPTLGRIIFGGDLSTDISKDERDTIQAAMDFRNRLVHGIAGSIPADKADEAFYLLLNASRRITTYVNEHNKRGMFARAYGPLARCKKCSKRKGCKFQSAKKVAEEQAKNRKIKTEGRYQTTNSQFSQFSSTKRAK